ncbi:MAG TPA: hypothetical protein VFW31_07235, partial [Candidatus Angelobacter sp.]|nr:hypothetical protein [Candidatus Angelobacter sp.]
MRLSLRLSVFLLLSAATQLLAYDDWQPITPEDQKITSASANGADAIILYHEEVSDDNARHRNIYMRIKILSEKG